MIDLHLHLDGSLTPEDLVAMSRLTGEPLPTEDREELRAGMTFDGRGTLGDYLKKFDLPLSVMQTGDAVQYAVQSLGNRLAAMGYDYAEVRFAPCLHTEKGSSMDAIVQGAVKGLLSTPLPMGLILCCMRGREEKENLRTVELAAEWRGRGVVGVDLAGAEAIYPTKGYREVFSLAAKLGLNITIHAGEAAGEDSVRAALDFGARRIGHGVAAAKSESLLKRIKECGVAIEVCPTSNLQTGAVPSLQKHPIPIFLKKGIPIILCSDNMTVSDTDIPREKQRLQAVFSYGEEDFSAWEAVARTHCFRGAFMRDLPE